MRLKIASRQSDLARWQAVQVGEALRAQPGVESVDYAFKASLGDQNLDLPLAGMGAKGVFTEDFYRDLVEGSCDLVVHSWKDLPVEERDSTEIVMTLNRADTRDLLLITHEAWTAAVGCGRLTVLTSSPRRIYNLGLSLAGLLPAEVELEFVNVRGNVPTRLRKMQEQGAALILAKAGLERLLDGERTGFLPGDKPLSELVKQCRFMILPLSLNPGAPAQGALAVEVGRARGDLKALCARLNDASAYSSVSEERRILASHGGGCHQKIGVTILPLAHGRLLSLRGLTDQGEKLETWTLENATPWVRAERAQDVFPLEAKDNSWFKRATRPLSLDLSQRPALFVTRAEALPAGFRASAYQLMWSAGVSTWRRLAEQGHWVNGCFDGLGEAMATGVETLVGPVKWIKLTHSDGNPTPGMDLLATYSLSPNEKAPDLRGKTHFFWMSSTAFERARQLFPSEIQNGYNAAGPGSTYDFLQRQSGLKNPPKAFAGLQQFLTESLS